MISITRSKLGYEIVSIITIKSTYKAAIVTVKLPLNYQRGVAEVSENGRLKCLNAMGRHAF